jgi:hypothetical protein
MQLWHGGQRQGYCSVFKKVSSEPSNTLQNATWCCNLVCLIGFAKVIISLWSVSTIHPGYFSEHASYSS